MKEKCEKRNCPECNHWWFDHERCGCNKGHKHTNTTLMLWSEGRGFGPCKDDTSPKDN